MLPTSNLELRSAFYQEVRAVVRIARTRAYRVLNAAMVESNWNIGRLIVEEEQNGNVRAEYAAYLIPNLSKRLTQEFRRGYGKASLKNCRQFYLTFPAAEGGPIGYTLCSQFSPQTEVQSSGDVYLHTC